MSVAVSGGALPRVAEKRSGTKVTTDHWVFHWSGRVRIVRACNTSVTLKWLFDTENGSTKLRTMSRMIVEKLRRNNNRLSKP